MTKTFYKGHKKEKTAQLHLAYDEMEKEDALKYAVGQLRYTHAGAMNWFSHWNKVDPKPVKKTKKPAAPKKTATAPVREVKAPAKKKVTAKKTREAVAA